MGSLTAIIQKASLLELLLAVWFLVTMIYLLRAQRRKPNFDMTDLVTGDNGRVSMSKFGQCGAFMVSSWGFVHLVITANLSEWYYATYMIAWTGTGLLNKMLEQRQAKSVTTVEATVTETKPAQGAEA